MLSLMVVDDEPYIVDGLYELIQEIDDLELNVYKAYSAVEAMNIITTSKMDIVITDIEMPGMSGLELHGRIATHWPKCRVIFLTGYSDFSYVQHAVRSGATDFILKTEGDEKIIETVYKAARSIRQELDAEKLLDDAKRHLEKALPALKRDYLLYLSEGAAAEGDDTRGERFAELGIELTPHAPVLLVLGRMDNWRTDLSGAGKALLLYGVQNISEEYLSRCTVEFFAYSVNRFAMFLQPKPDEKMGSEELARFVLGMLDPIQSSCKTYLKLSVSLVASTATVEWDNVGQRWMELERALGAGLGLGQEVLLTEGAAQAGDEPRVEPSTASEQHLYRALKQVDRAEAAIENGQREPFMQWFAQVAGATGSAPPFSPLQTEAYYAVAQLLLRAVNRSQPARGAGGKAGGGVLSPEQLDRLMHLRSHGSWHSATMYLQDMADLLFAGRQQDQTDRSDELVLRLNRYIHEHLEEDLSLARLSEKVYMNPSYLSRLYKQLTGIGLSDFIFEARMERAKELLRHSRHKVQEIGRIAGFDNPAYFARLFKKYSGFTPVEYREQYAEDGLEPRHR